MSNQEDKSRGIGDRVPLLNAAGHANNNEEGFDGMPMCKEVE